MQYSAIFCDPDSRYTVHASVERLSIVEVHASVPELHNFTLDAIAACILALTWA